MCAVFGASISRAHHFLCTNLRHSLVTRKEGIKILNNVRWRPGVHLTALACIHVAGVSPGARAELTIPLGKVQPFLDSGEARIRQLGYKQELQRNFTLLSIAGLVFTVVSIVTGITGVRNVGMHANFNELLVLICAYAVWSTHSAVRCSLLLRGLLQWRPCGDCVRLVDSLCIQSVRRGLHGGNHILAAHQWRALLLVRRLSACHRSRRRLLQHACVQPFPAVDSLKTICRSVELAKGTALSEAFVGWLTGAQPSPSGPIRPHRRLRRILGATTLLEKGFPECDHACTRAGSANPAMIVQLHL